MSRFAVGNLFLLLSMTCAAISQILLKSVLQELPEPLAWATLRPFLTIERAVRGGLAVTLIGSGFLFWVLCLVRLELSYAYPIACSTVLLVALLSWLLLGETLTLRMWIGTLLILVGVALLTPEAR